MEFRAGFKQEDLDAVLNDVKMSDANLERWKPTHMIRHEGRVMSIPLKACDIIIPRHGDILLECDLVEFGYRNEGVWFWHRDHGAIRCDDKPDDYGCVPHYFHFPEFPLDYYEGCMAHNNIVHVDVTSAHFMKREDSPNVLMRLGVAPEQLFVIAPWDEETLNMGDFADVKNNILALDKTEKEGEWYAYLGGDFYSEL